MSVKPKKHLGQHFLTDNSVAEKIANTLSFKGYDQVLEIGPGTGVLTEFLLSKTKNLHLIEIDTESVEYLQKTYLNLRFPIIEKDFLKWDPTTVFGEEQYAIIGNFPYNISTQIVFKTLEYRDKIPEFAGMFQKEVAERICENEGNKTYGILSVLTKAFYETEYLFTVPPSVFNPPPKVESGVMRMRRKENFKLKCNEELFFKVVKTSFQQRRKTLRNSLKIFNISDSLKANAIFGRRPEQLSVAAFLELTQMIEEDRIT